MRYRLPVLMLLSLAVSPSLQRAQSSQSEEGIDERVLSFLSRNCYACHGGKLKSGNLNLEAYGTRASLLRDREQWERVLHKLRTGEMPPEGIRRPDAEEAAAVLRWIDLEFERADRLAVPDPGRVTARRLNRTEYNNTVRDLLGVTDRPADDFPQDDAGYGFDNVGDVLSVSPSLAEKYLLAAERIARSAVLGPMKVRPTLVRLRPRVGRITPGTVPLSDYDLTGLSLPNALHLYHRFPVEGEYVFRFFTGGVRPGGSEPLTIALWIDGEQVDVGKLDSERIASFSEQNQDLSGQSLDFRTRVEAGEHWIAASPLRLYEGLPPGYGGPNPSTRLPPAPPEFVAPPGAPPGRIAEMKKRFEARLEEAAPVNTARISSVEIGGPYSQAAGPSPESKRKIYACGDMDGIHKPECSRRNVAALARRAYRRPVSRKEIDRLHGLVAMARKKGDSMEEGLVQAIQAMLVSPYFLFRIERDSVPGARDGPHPISEHELASRLSYFLWASMPDEALLRCADEQLLRKPGVLEAQVRRMLRDPKSRALAESFGGQWLQIRSLESVRPDPQRFPEFDEFLRRSMVMETEHFFLHVVQEDRSIVDFIDGKYSFLNERLARFYGISGVRGHEFRRVELQDSRRGGVLTQASVLTVSSYATRTSPVLRGKWILENLLNAPPPPPPPDVPNLEESAIGSTASLREQMEKHRTNPTCASCHARMDPLGFGLENYDAIGAWRTGDGRFPIDASGSLPDGRSFRGPDELRAILKGERDAFARCLTEKLLTYALGRGLEPYDRSAVRKIADRLKSGGYRFSTLVLGIVESLPFQMRRGDRTP